jgi:hypothetical protein
MTEEGLFLDFKKNELNQISAVATIKNFETSKDYIKNLIIEDIKKFNETPDLSKVLTKLIYAALR